MKPCNWRAKTGPVNQHYFWNDTWRFGVLVVWPVNIKQVRFIARKIGATQKSIKELCYREIGIGHYFHFGNGLNIIAFSRPGKERSKSEVMNTVAHEAFHCISAELLSRKISLSEADDEAWAYTLAWLVQRIVEARKL